MTTRISSPEATPEGIGTSSDSDVPANMKRPSSFAQVPSPPPVFNDLPSSSAATARYIFWVCKLNNRITTCFGCRGKFTRAADGTIPFPPLDLILRCKESRQYYGKDGSMQEKGNANTYYHPNTSCIKKKHPNFQLTDIRVDDATNTSLLPCHLDLLQLVFNFYPNPC